MEASPEINTMKSPANGTDDREARSFCWYAARTQMNCERKAEKEFKGIAIETYLPTQEEIHQWSDRKKKVQRMVIPMVLFVKMNSADANNVHRTPYFYGFIGNNRHDTKPAPIPDKDIETLRFMLLHSDSPVSIETMPIKLGDKVRVIRGQLQGLEGNILSMTKSHSEIVINLNILGCAKVTLLSANIQIIPA
jgi:transcription antitermination factor NusG